MVQPKCSICGKDLMSNEGFRKEMINDMEVKILIEPQISYWAHDPRNLHVDVLVTAHKECYNKIKASYKNFDSPVEDYATCRFPTLKDGVITLKTPTDFIKKTIE
jgi:hypothetical protein